MSAAGHRSAWLALACVCVALGGCAGGGGSGGGGEAESGSHGGGNGEAERVEEAKREEASEVSKDREILLQLETKKREEATAKRAAARVKLAEERARRSEQNAARKEREANERVARLERERDAAQRAKPPPPTRTPAKHSGPKAKTGAAGARR